MSPFIDLGGHRLSMTEDQFPDGRKCFIAEHPDIEGCVAYADTAAGALDALRQTRMAIEAVERERSKPKGRTPKVPRLVAQSSNTNTAMSGNGLSLLPA